MLCDTVLRALADFSTCEATENGARVATHCLYPSFDPVKVYVAKVGDGYRVHDGSGAYDSAWIHGRDDWAISRAISDECYRFHLMHTDDNSIVATVSSLEWIVNAIVSVANASSRAANTAVAKIAAVSEHALTEKIEFTLAEHFNIRRVEKEIVLKGKSGGDRRFDFRLIGHGGNDILINAVAPHKNAIAAKYVSFADVDVDRRRKLAVFDRQLETKDGALLQQVASVVPLASLAAGAQRAVDLV